MRRSNIVVYYIKSKEKLRIAIPLKRWGQPEDGAKVALFLSSDDASHIAGATSS